MRRERRAAPLLALLVFEVVAIIGLQAVGSNQAMQVPWGDFWTWMDTSSVDVLAMPLLRYAALGLAYWMLVSTLLFVAAQLTRIPVAIRAAGMFTLPSVRRAVDGAMAVSIATTSVVGFASAAVAVDGTGDTSSSSLAGLVTTMNAADGSVSTPSFSAATSPHGEVDVDVDGAETTGTTVLNLTGSPNDNDLVTTSTTPSTPASNYTSRGDVIDQASSNDQATTSLAPSAGSDFVPTPRPGAPITTTTVPQGPSTSSNTPPPVVETPAQETPAAAPSASGTHRVVPGDNLWTIARDHIASSTDRTKGQITESEIRNYWLKVIDANRDSLRSHDPHWIFPGEIIQLPALESANAGS